MESSHRSLFVSGPPDLSIHLFQATEHQYLLDSHVQLLSYQEQQRAAGSSNPEVHLLSYILLRKLLGKRTGIAPFDLDLKVGAPGFRTHINDVNTPIALSISRTSELIAIALANRAVGIDVENHQSKAQSNLLLSLLHPADRKRLRKAGPKEITAAWTRKEATLKAMAQGLSRDPALDEVGTRRHPLAPTGWAASQSRLPKSLAAELAVAWKL